MNLKLQFIIAIFFLLNKSFGQTNSAPSNLKTLVEQSFQKYPRVESMTQVVRLNEVQVTLAKAGYLPGANGVLSYRRLYPTPSFPIPPRMVQLFPADNFNAEVDLNQPILDLNTGAKIGKAKSNLTSANDNLDNLKSQLAYQIAQIYYSIIFLNKSLLVQQQQLDLLKANLQQIKVKMDNGFALKFDLLSTQVQYSNSENYFADLQTQRSKQYNTLNMLTGHTDLNYISDTIINQTIFEVLKDSLLTTVNANNPDIRIANDKIEVARWDITSANRLRMPTMNLSAGAGFKNGFVPNLGTNTFNYFVGVSITIPLLPVSRPTLQKKLAEINLSTYQSDLNTQTMAVTNNVLNALQDVQKNEKKLATSDDLIEMAHAALLLAMQRYKEGVNTNLDLLTAQTNYQNAQLNKLQFEYNLMISKMDVCQLAGNRWW